MDPVCGSLRSTLSIIPPGYLHICYACLFLTLEGVGKGLDPEFNFYGKRLSRSRHSL